jgi:hypothetical protein
MLRARVSAGGERERIRIQILFRSALRDAEPPRHISLSRFILSPAIDFVTSDPGPNHFYLHPAHPAARSFLRARQQAHTFTSSWLVFFIFPAK